MTTWHPEELAHVTETALHAHGVASSASTTARALTEDISPNGLTPPAAAAARLPNDLNRAIADARMQIVEELLSLSKVYGMSRAFQILVGWIATGQAHPTLREAAQVANRRTKASTVSLRTLLRWLALYREGGWRALLPPVPTPLAPDVKGDVAATLGLYLSRDARYRKLTACAVHVNRQLGRPQDAWTSLYNRTRRALPKLDPVQVIQSRHLGAARAARLPFKRRDTSTLSPNDVWLVDGHTFKAKVRHPIHGAPFAPEVTLCIDAATRLVCGWSVSLSENTTAVGDALRHAVGRCGVPAVVYTDNGAGQTGRQIDCPVTGLMARLGIEHRTGRPGHPQGRGLIERSWQTHMLQAARGFGSYQGKDVDPVTFRRAAAELEREQRAVRRMASTGEAVVLSAKAPSWAQFMAAVAQAIERYNTAHRHRALPKDDAGRHWTAAQAWASHQHTPVTLAPHELRMMFMPAELRIPRRGEVQFLNQVYASPDLMAVDGKQVRCHFDIHDPSFVLVFSLTGEFICEARFEANKINFLPQAVIEIGREKRARAAVRRLDEKRALALREVSQVLNAPTDEAAALPSNALPAQVSARDPERPLFDSESERYEWLMVRRGCWTPADLDWLSAFSASDDYAALAGFFASRGLAWAAPSSDHVLPP